MDATHVWDYVVLREAANQKCRVRVGLGVVEGRLECISLGINPLRPGGITSDVVRDLNVSSLVREARRAFLPSLRQAVETGEGLPPGLNDKERRQARAALKTLLPLAEVESRRSDRSGPTIDELQAVADTYRLALTNADRPRQAVARRLSLSPSGASKWIRRARDAGLLGETDPGKQGERRARSEGRKRRSSARRKKRDG